jgi:hypothetical protein
MCNKKLHRRNLLHYSIELGMYRDRESQARSFLVAKVFTEVSNLLRHQEKRREHTRGSRSVFPVVLFVSPDIPSKLLTLLKSN